MPTCRVGTPTKYSRATTMHRVNAMLICRELALIQTFDPPSGSEDEYPSRKKEQTHGPLSSITYATVYVWVDGKGTIYFLLVQLHQHKNSLWLTLFTFTLIFLVIFSFFYKTRKFVLSEGLQTQYWLIYCQPIGWSQIVRSAQYQELWCFHNTAIFGLEYYCGYTHDCLYMRQHSASPYCKHQCLTKLTVM